jgi:formylglycine-generating enzyme required for sulfatase activity
VVAEVEEPLRAALVDLLAEHEPAVPQSDRITAGFLLGELGDPRFPVTIEEWRIEITKALAGDTSGYFCKVEAGTYVIGSSDDDPDANDDEKPQHTVTFDEPFWIGRYPITYRQLRWYIYTGNGKLRCTFENRDTIHPLYGTYEQFVSVLENLRNQRGISPNIPTEDDWKELVKEGWDSYSHIDKPDHNCPNQPIFEDYNVVSTFCVWLRNQTGCHIRLPTEFEWEAAARGGDARYYPWGNDWHEDYAAKVSIKRSTPVGCYPKGHSPCGALDMVGNVSEWTDSEWITYLTGSSPKEPIGKVLRGGGTRCTTREWDNLGLTLYYWGGLRLVLILNNSAEINVIDE